MDISSKIVQTIENCSFCISYHPMSTEVDPKKLPFRLPDKQVTVPPGLDNDPRVLGFLPNRLGMSSSFTSRKLGAKEDKCARRLADKNALTSARYNTDQWWTYGESNSSFVNANDASYHWTIGPFT